MVNCIVYLHYLFFFSILQHFFMLALAASVFFSFTFYLFYGVTRTAKQVGEMYFIVSVD